MYPILSVYRVMSACVACLFFVAKVLSRKVLGKRKKVDGESRARVCFARL
jgi:hypothetical protein